MLLDTPEKIVAIGNEKMVYKINLFFNDLYLMNFEQVVTERLCQA